MLLSWVQSFLRSMNGYWLGSIFNIIYKFRSIRVFGTRPWWHWAIGLSKYWELFWLHIKMSVFERLMPQYLWESRHLCDGLNICRKKQPQYSQQVPSGRPSHGEFKKWLMSSLILLIFSIKPTKNHKFIQSLK